MRRLQITALVALPLFFAGCSMRQVGTYNNVEGLNDVYLLSITVQDYLRNGRAGDFSKDVLISGDSLRRISKNFERIQQINHGGYIAIRYKFSRDRDATITLTQKEQERINSWRIFERKFRNDDDGEIQFAYGERFYNFRKIIQRKESF